MTSLDTETPGQLDLFADTQPGEVLGYCAAYPLESGSWHITGTIESRERVQQCVTYQRRLDPSTGWRMLEIREVPDA